MTGLLKGTPRGLALFILLVTLALMTVFGAVRPAWLLFACPPAAALLAAPPARPALAARLLSVRKRE